MAKLSLMEKYNIMYNENHPTRCKLRVACFEAGIPDEDVDAVVEDVLRNAPPSKDASDDDIRMVLEVRAKSSV